MLARCLPQNPPQAEPSDCETSADFYAEVGRCPASKPCPSMPTQIRLLGEGRYGDWLDPSMIQESLHIPRPHASQSGENPKRKMRYNFPFYPECVEGMPFEYRSCLGVMPRASVLGRDDAQEGSGQRYPIQGPEKHRLRGFSQTPCLPSCPTPAAPVRDVCRAENPRRLAGALEALHHRHV